MLSPRAWGCRSGGRAYLIGRSRVAVMGFAGCVRATPKPPPPKLRSLQFQKLVGCRVSQLTTATNDQPLSQFARLDCVLFFFFPPATTAMRLDVKGHGIALPAEILLRLVQLHHNRQLDGQADPCPASKQVSKLGLPTRGSSGPAFPPPDVGSDWRSRCSTLHGCLPQRTDLPLQ